MATAATVTPSPTRSHRVGDLLIELSAISFQLFGFQQSAFSYQLHSAPNQKAQMKMKSRSEE
jgi:hypothetical protein